MTDLDDVLFLGKRIAFEDRNETMVTKKATPKKYVSNCAGLDVGTGWLVGSSFITKGQKMEFTPLRDCFYSLNEEMFSRSMFNKDKVKYVEHDDQIHIVGEDALTLAKIQNGVAQRPMAKGVINPNERSSAPILREMIRYCIEANPVRKGGKVVFSVPAAVIDSEAFNVEYHALSISSLLSSLGYEAEALNEAYAVIISEMEDADEVTGLGLSFGAGLVNVAMSYKGMLLFEFSINKSGDFIDLESSKACGVSESMMNHIKEKQLDLTEDEFKVGPEERALIFTHKHVIRNAIQNIVKAFKGSDSVNIIEPIPVIISGGTTMPNGFVELFEQELNATNLPFEVTEVIPAKDRLTAVAKGCLMWANR